AASATGATAAEFDTGNPDLSLRWDNTLKYSATWRVKGRDAALLGRPNTDDANQNFDKGLVSNRLDWLTELDLVHAKTRRLRLSAAGWYDRVYNRRHGHPG